MVVAVSVQLALYMACAINASPKTWGRGFAPRMMTFVGISVRNSLQRLCIGARSGTLTRLFRPLTSQCWGFHATWPICPFWLSRYYLVMFAAHHRLVISLHFLRLPIPPPHVKLRCRFPILHGTQPPVLYYKDAPVHFCFGVSRAIGFRIRGRS